MAIQNVPQRVQTTPQIAQTHLRLAMANTEAQQAADNELRRDSKPPQAASKCDRMVPFGMQWNIPMEKFRLEGANLTILQTR